ncbi:hypothetical protein BOTBODRAFT_175466 [Botryobasidium botryosum FD-172 SS1]|uniref:Uncharacterized protein n=1 Tax=Botryobasidium botryosum (strain FD-172 SS1) TaxID=930990 RepID=A0A067MNJ8_BOTB1|nr:hypothetical protein BOTBODRAFT_175466 [Botryobasidium botryosum FD-172 SS1]
MIPTTVANFFPVFVSAKRGGTRLTLLTDDELLRALDIQEEPQTAAPRVIRWTEGRGRARYNIAVVFSVEDAALAVSGQHGNMRASLATEGSVRWRAVLERMSATTTSPSSTSPVASLLSLPPPPPAAPQPSFPSVPPAARAAPAWLLRAPAHMQDAYRAHKAHYLELIAPFCGEHDVPPASEEERQRREACGVACAVELKAAYALREAMVAAELGRAKQERAAGLARAAVVAGRLERQRRFDALTAHMEAKTLERLDAMLTARQAYLADLLEDIGDGDL